MKSFLITLSPSPLAPNFKPGQVDQDSLPDYDTLDDILERPDSKATVCGMTLWPQGTQQPSSKKVIRLVTRAEFKRRQAPPVLKVTDRAFGMGWRMPIASRWALEISDSADKVPLEMAVLNL